MGTQEEYVSNIMTGEPLSAPVIRRVRVAEPSVLEWETSGLWHSTNLLHGLIVNERVLISFLFFTENPFILVSIVQSVGYSAIRDASEQIVRCLIRLQIP